MIIKGNKVSKFSPCYRIICYIISFTLLFSCITVLSACDKQIPYSGEYPELAACTIFSIPGVSTDLSDQIIILETDQYGRILYGTYLSNSWLSTEEHPFSAIIAILVLQKVSDEYIHFYPEENYRFVFVNGNQNVTDDTIWDYFNDDEIKVLKEVNDWGIEPQSTKKGVIVKAPITVEKNSSYSRNMEKILNQKIGNNHRTELFREDANGKKAYFVLNIITGKESKLKPDEWWMVIFDANGELIQGENNPIKISNLKAMSKEVKEFLRANNWQDIQ